MKTYTLKQTAQAVDTIMDTAKQISEQMSIVTAPAFFSDTLDAENLKPINCCDYTYALDASINDCIQILVQMNIDGTEYTATLHKFSRPSVDGDTIVHGYEGLLSGIYCGKSCTFEIILVIDDSNVLHWSVSKVNATMLWPDVKPAEFIPELDENGEPVLDENGDPVGEVVGETFQEGVEIKESLQILRVQTAFIIRIYGLIKSPAA